MSEVTDKKYYRMGEVSSMTGIESHVLRFWENEFSQLNPRKSASGHRTFSEADLDLIHRIKHLLHEQGFTIAGARKRLAAKEDQPPARIARKKRVLSEIREVKDLLRNVLNLLDHD